MNIDVKKRLIEGNFKFQWKLTNNEEKIEIQHKIPKYPVLILTCMDPRIDVHRLFQLEIGDVFILRNAGNILTNDMLRSILIVIHNYNIKNIVVLGHTDCGVTKIKLDELRLKLLPESLELICQSGQNPLVEMRKFFKPFIDELENIKNQIKELKDFKGIPKDVGITGMLYDVNKGWVFEYDKIMDLKFIENFRKEYKNLIDKKRIELVDFIESIEKPNVKSGGLNIKSGNTIKIEFNEGIENRVPSINKKAQDNLINQENVLYPDGKPLFKYPCVKIPKINLPKVKVNIPDIYKKNKHEIY